MDNEYELLYLAKENDEEYINVLMKKYYHYLYKKSFFYSRMSHISIQELLNESLVSFYKAIFTYQDKQKFSTYLNALIDNNLINYIKKNNNSNNRILNDAISYDSNLILNSDIDYNSNPEYIVINEEKYYELKNKITCNMSWKEELVLNLIEQNYSCKEISNITDISLRTVYNIINKLQKKTVKLMSI